MKQNKIQSKNKIELQHIYKSIERDLPWNRMTSTDQRFLIGSNVYKFKSL